MSVETTKSLLVALVVVWPFGYLLVWRYAGDVQLRRHVVGATLAIAMTLVAAIALAHRASAEIDASPHCPVGSQYPCWIVGVGVVGLLVHVFLVVDLAAKRRAASACATVVCCAPYALVIAYCWFVGSLCFEF